jgi:hypothetical protein
MVVDRFSGSLLARLVPIGLKITSEFLNCTQVVGFSHSIHLADVFLWVITAK